MNEYQDNYRFEFIITKEDGEVVVSGSTYISNVDRFGGCESVGLEVSSALRYLNDLEEKKRLSIPDDEED